jgi:glycosyltransferase involved in cell wall biosynthesis
MLESLRAQARDLGLEDAVRFEPTSSRVADWMRQIDIFVLSSESESFPNALLEAMACGCCPVASAVGGVPELITDGQNGLLCPPNDIDRFSMALRRVVADAQLRDRLRSAAARTARDEFSAERYVACTTELYGRLLATDG